MRPNSIQLPVESTEHLIENIFTYNPVDTWWLTLLQQPHQQEENTVDIPKKAGISRDEQYLDP